MTIVTVSTRYQILIPAAVRERLGIEPGQRLEVFAFRNRIELVPVKRPGDLRGFLESVENDFTRAPDRI